MTSSPPPHLVIVFGYNRVDKLRNRLLELRKISPPKILVSIDFFSEEMSADFNFLMETEQGTWPENSTLEFKIHGRNLGLVRHITETITDCLRTYEFVILVEDDISVSEGFYNSSLAYITKKSFHERYTSFSGYSIFPAIRGVDRYNLLRESPYFACWGWVVSRENWKDFKVDLRGEEITETLSNSKVWNNLNLKQRETWLGRFKKSQENPWNTWDIQFQYHSFKLDKLNLVPTLRIVENEGFDDPRSTHTQNIRPRIMGRFRFSNKKVRSRFLPKSINKHTTRMESLLFYQDSRQLFNLVKRLKKLINFQF